MTEERKIDREGKRKREERKEKGREGDRERERERERESIHPVHKHSASDTSIKRNKVLADADGSALFPRVMDFVSDGSAVNPRPNAFFRSATAEPMRIDSRLPSVDLLDEVLR